MKQVDLRAKPAPAPTPKPAQQPQRIGPLPAGTVLTSETPLTADERATLQQAGLRLAPAASLPKEAAQAAAAEVLAPVAPPGGSPLEMPTPVALADLPPERQASFKAALDEYRQVVKQRTEEKPAAQAAPEKPVESPKAPTADAFAPSKNFCPHCGWDQEKPGAEITDQDKLDFLQATLGQQRFVKIYQMLGGKLLVAFRTLTTAEADMCYTQAAYDVDNKLIMDPGQYYRTIEDYRLCLGLAMVDYGAVKHELPTMDGYMVEATLPPRTTALKKIVPYVYDQVLQYDSVRRACAASYFRFARLVERLEAATDNPNFWPGTDGQP